MPDPPDPPAELTGDRVTEYTKRYEFVYRRLDRAGIAPTPVTEIRLDAIAEVRTRGPDWVIVDVIGRLAGRWDPDPTETGAPGNFDGSDYVGNYLLTRQAVWRAETEFEDVSSEPDPVADGELLECF